MPPHTTVPPHTRRLDYADPGASELPGWRESPAIIATVSRAAELGLWGLVISGPVIGLLALADGAPESAPAAIAADPAPSGVGPAGTAALYVSAWLSTGQGTEEAVRGYYPGLAAADRAPGQYAARQITPIAVDQLGGGYWSVTVAAHVTTRLDDGPQDTGIRYYRVGIVAAGGPNAGGTGDRGDAAAYVATGLPAEVAPPRALPAVELVYDNRLSTSASEPVAATVSGFLSAYLLGDGELARYVAPGAPIAPLAPPPYVSFDLRSVSATGEAGAVSAAGRLNVLATIDAFDPHGIPSSLSYPLRLVARDGRWEVSAIDPAPVMPRDQAAAGAAANDN